MRQLLRERRARQDLVGAGLAGLCDQLGLHVGAERHNRQGREFRLHSPQQVERVGRGQIEIDDQRARIAKHVGEELEGCAWVGIPFAGGMCELIHIDAGSILVNDKHRWIVNLARVIQDPTLAMGLMREVDAKLFHPDELAIAQRRLRSRESAGGLFGSKSRSVSPAFSFKFI